MTVPSLPKQQPTDTLKVDQQVIACRERRAVTPRLEDLVRLAHSLKVSDEELLGNTPQTLGAVFRLPCRQQQKIVAVAEALVAQQAQARET